MAAPSKSWTDILDSKIDADSPVLEELMTWIRDNIVHGDERIGVAPTDAARQENHGHKGLGEDGSALIVLSDKIKFKDEPAPLTKPTGLFSNLDVSVAVVPNLSEIEMQWFNDSASTLNDISVKLQHDDANAANGIMGEAADFLYIGMDRTFGKVVVKTNDVRSGQGVIIAEYYNGVGFAALSGVVDGTESGGDTLVQDGEITFTIPIDWAIGADNIQAGLDSSLFFIRLSQTNDPSADQNVEQGVPKTDTASLAIVLVIGGGSAEWRKDGVTNTQVTSSGRATVVVPLANEIFEHKNSSSPTTYNLAGYIL